MPTSRNSPVILRTHPHPVILRTHPHPVILRTTKSYRRIHYDETGSVTVASLGVVAVVIFVLSTLAYFAVTLGTALSTSHAADLSALAGASVWQLTSDAAAACSTAKSVAAANRANLITCEVDGENLIVSVQKSRFTRQAKAGPSDEGCFDLW